MSIESQSPETSGEQSQDPTLSDLPEVRHTGHLNPEAGQDLPAANAPTTTLRSDAAADNLPTAPETAAAIAPPLSPEPTREPSRVFSSRRNQLIAGGLLAAVAVGAIGANALSRGGDNPKPRAVATTEPARTTPPTVTSTSEAPSSTASSATTEATSPTSSEASTTPATGDTVTPTPPKSGEVFGTMVSVPLSYFQGLIDKDKVAARAEQDPDFAEHIKPSSILIQAAAKDITAKKIARYQKQLAAAYEDPNIAQVLGTPNGSFDPTSISQTDKTTAQLSIGLTSNTWLLGIARQVHQKIPGATSDLVKFAFLNDDRVKTSKAKIDAGVGSQARGNFYGITSTEVDAATNYQTEDGATVTLIAATSTYQNGDEELDYYVLVPFEAESVYMTPGSFMAIPYYER